MEQVFGFIDIIFLFVFVFLLFYVLGYLAKHAQNLKVFGIVLGVLTLLLVFHAFFPYSLIASLGGYIAGLALNGSPLIFRRAYILALITSVSVAVLDLLYDSGIVRFGFSSITQLFEPDLCFYAIPESFIEVLITTVATILWFGIASMVVRLFSKSRPKRMLASTLIVACVMYLLEPQLHLRIQHPLVVHHPYFTLSTVLGVAIGIWGASIGLLKPVRLIRPERPIVAVTAYFSIYHFILVVSERTSGWLFDIPYGTTMALTIAVTLPFGVLFHDLWRGLERETVPSPREVMRKIGMSEYDLTRLQKGKYPFKDTPEHFLREAENKFPDLVQLAWRKFDTGRKMNNRQQVPHTWENLPSMVMTPVPRGFSYSHLIEEITKQAPDKQLVCLVHWGWTSSQEDALRRINLLYKFADDPKLVLMRFLAPVPGQEQIIIRASFMRETASQITASNLFDLAERLSELAREKGLNTTTVE